MNSKNYKYKSIMLVASMFLIGAGIAGANFLINKQQLLESEIIGLNKQYNQIDQKLDQLSQQAKSKKVLTPINQIKAAPQQDSDNIDEQMLTQLESIAEAIGTMKTQLEELEMVVYADDYQSDVFKNEDNNGPKQISGGFSGNDQSDGQIDELFNAYDLAFNESEYNPGWSSGVEQSIISAHTAFADSIPNNNTNIIQNECRTGMCKIVVTHTDLMEADRYQKNMMINLASALPSFSMDTRNDNGVITNTYYFYASNEYRPTLSSNVQN